MYQSNLNNDKRWVHTVGNVVYMSMSQRDVSQNCKNDKNASDLYAKAVMGNTEGRAGDK